MTEFWRLRPNRAVCNNKWKMVVFNVVKARQRHIFNMLWIIKTFWWKPHDFFALKPLFAANETSLFLFYVWPAASLYDSAKLIPVIPVISSGSFMNSFMLMRVNFRASLMASDVCNVQTRIVAKHVSKIICQDPQAAWVEPHFMPTHISRQCYFKTLSA